MTQRFKKTRLAPTPSGYLHIGNVISFLITCSLARHHGAKVLLRIDDLDSDRVRPEYLQDIFDTLEFLEIPYDEGPRSQAELKHHFSQGLRMDLYKNVLEILREKNLVFACECSRKKIRQHHPKGWYNGACINRGLSLNGANTCWRLYTGHSLPRQIKQYPDSIKSCHLPEAMNHFIVRKKDGDPAYQLSSLADDIHFGVDLIVRGEDLWESTCAQIYLSACLETNPLSKVTFFHHPLVTAGKQKLSKSSGALAIKTMRQNGWSKADIYRLAGKELRLKTPVHSLADFEAAFITDAATGLFNRHSPE
ncbi:glutamyl-tRNA synthetase [Cyclobacterium lianum]|uniref:Glutamyl-tRNA synthetase n=1 Tax=Cyclobacterium lianum TaxID=388280 RepID=A0A1M7NEA4_9BACT|nr:glutamate--tRNA ligase family protein [Cyclobacterium lianum]SHN01557.1 glutamyl-tRNA synthetase [Cyclobacterium lianum]